MVTAEVSALACEGGCVVGGGEWVCGCERVVVVVVAVEEEWLKSSSAGIKTTGLAERRRLCTRPKTVVLLPFRVTWALGCCPGQRDSVGMRISPCTQRKNMQS
jgi:hypothetical protein